MKVRLSRSGRVQLHCLDLVNCVVENLPFSHAKAAEPIPDGVEDLVADLAQTREYLFRWMTGGRMEITRGREFWTYRDTVAEMAAVIHADFKRVEFYQGVRRFLNAVLLVVADVSFQVPADPPERKKAFDDMEATLAALLAVYDPDLTDGEAETLGADLGVKLRGLVFAN